MPAAMTNNVLVRETFRTACVGMVDVTVRHGPNSYLIR